VVKAEPPKVPVETLSVHVVKGSNGFGFTIADSNQGQRIKQIMDASRCQDLQEGDLLIEINGFNVQRYSHNEVVNMLKSCPRDTEAAIIVQRGGRRRLTIKKSHFVPKLNDIHETTDATNLTFLCFSL
jgi:hypothetical protein